MNPNVIVGAVVGALSTFAAVAAWFEPEPERTYACETSHAAAMAMIERKHPGARMIAAGPWGSLSRVEVYGSAATGTGVVILTWEDGPACVEHDLDVVR